jgi:vitamin B12 transporter
MRKALILLLIPIYGYSQDTNEIDEVLVTGNRMETSLMESGRNIQIITKLQIESMPVQNVNELLQYVSGVDFRQRGAWGAQVDVSLRGGTFDQTLILVNGIKMNDPQTGHHNMNLVIDLASIKQIEVIKGPAASRYGLNAFSGVINIITEPSSENQVEVSGSLGQDLDTRLPNKFYGGYQARAAAHLGTGKSRHFVSASRLQSTGYRSNTDLNRHTVNYQGLSKTKMGDFNMMGSFVQNDFGASGFYAFPIDATSEEQVTTYSASVQHSVQFDKIRLNTKAYLRKNFDTYTLFRDAPEIFQNNHRTDVGGAELHATYKYRIGQAGAGFEYRQEDINSSNLGKWTRTNLGFFAENKLFLPLNLALHTGLYVNQSNDFGSQVLPSAEVVYFIYEDLSAYAGAGFAFRLPTFTDLYYVGPTNVGNANLKPEESINREGGLKYQHGAHFAQASLFYMTAENMIDWVRDSTNQPWQPQNYESANTLGAEFSYELQRTKKLTNWLDLGFSRVGYTWLNMKRSSSGDFISRYSLNNLRHQVTMQSSIIAYKGISLTLTGRYQDRMNNKSYWLVDTRLGYRKNGFNLWLDCTNLLDTDYTEAAAAPMPGRWFRLGYDAVLK